MTDTSDYRLVPAYNENGQETGYYTRIPDGISGMTVGALSEFCALASGATTTMSDLLTKIELSSPEANELSEPLKPFAGKRLRLEANDLQGRLIVPDEACYAIVEHYAYYARKYDGKEIARHNFRALGRAGIRVFIWSKTGYVPPDLRRPTSGRGCYWYERIKVALTDTEKPLQSGYFCVYVEMMGFFRELETRLDYVISDYDPETGRYLVPDISIAKRFNEWLRSENPEAVCARQRFLKSPNPIDFRPDRKNKDGWKPQGAHYYQIQPYNHIYPEASHGKNNIQPVRSYPNEYLAIFRYYLEEHWIPQRCVTYLLERDPGGMELIRGNLNLMPQNIRKALAATLVGKLIQSLPPSAA